jgi:hypothetical protein
MCAARKGAFSGGQMQPQAAREAPFPQPKYAIVISYNIDKLFDVKLKNQVFMICANQILGAKIRNWWAPTQFSALW